MPFTITVDISQATSLLSRLQQAITSDIPARALQAGADILVQRAQSSAPVRTGHLRSSIHAESATSTNVAVIAEADYAAYVEFGTSRMSAEPYIIPAIPEATSTIVDTAVQELQSVVG